MGFGMTTSGGRTAAPPCHGAGGAVFNFDVNIT